MGCHFVESLDSGRVTIEQWTGGAAKAQLPPIIRHVWSCGHGGGWWRATLATQALAPVSMCCATGVLSLMISRPITVWASVVRWNWRLDYFLGNLASWFLFVRRGAHYWGWHMVDGDNWKIIMYVLVILPLIYQLALQNFLTWCWLQNIWWKKLEAQRWFKYITHLTFL